MLLLTFTAGGIQYAIDVARIVELVPRVELRKIPHAPPFWAGLLGYRGKVVPVIDLGLLLDAGPCRDCLSTRIILVNDSSGDHNHWNQDREASCDETREAQANPKPTLNLLGLVAEHVSDLTYIRPEQIVPAPVQLPQTPYLGPIVQTDQGIVQLIVVEKVREASLQSSDLVRDKPLDLLSEPSPSTASIGTRRRDDG
jgi:chemotaxis-related protein WspB